MSEYSRISESIFLQTSKLAVYTTNEGVLIEGGRFVDLKLECGCKIINSVKWFLQEVNMQGQLVFSVSNQEYDTIRGNYQEP